MNPPYLYWYAGRTTYRNPAYVEDGAPKVIFEERIVLVQAMEFTDALTKIQAEADRYLQSHPKLELMDCTAIYCTQEEALAEGVEVWSILRETELTAADYAHHYHNNERESVLICKVIDETPEGNKL